SCEGGVHLGLRPTPAPANRANPFRNLRFRAPTAVPASRSTRSLRGVQEATEDRVDTAFAVRRNAFRDLLGCSDQLRTEPVVVLHQVLERRVGPHAAFVGRRAAGLLHSRAESLDRGTVGLLDDLSEDFLRFFLCVAGDDEAVESEADLATGWTDTAGVVAHLDELFGDPAEILAVGEVPVGVVATVAPCGRGVAALEDFRVGPLGRVERLGLQREIVDAVEV